MSSYLNRRARLLSASLVLGLALTACGGGGDEGNEPDAGSDAGSDTGAQVLTQESADGALLTLDDVGEGFVESPNADDEDDSDLGCLSGIEDLDDLEADTEAEVNFDAEGETSLRSVLSGVKAFEDSATPTDALEDFRTSLEGCDAVNVTDPAGFNLSIEVTVVDGEPIGDADEQVHLTGTGQVSTGPTQTYDYALTFVVSRVGNNLGVVGVIDLGSPGEDVVESLTETAVGRLVDATA